MPAVTFTIEPDELLGLNALVTLEKAEDNSAEADGTESGAEDGAVLAARTLLRAALAEKLTEANLPWAPSAEVASERAAEAAKPRGSLRRLTENKALRKTAAYVLTVATVVVVWGGYAERWRWTGFQANHQLWDWLQLLLLPIVAASVPLWLQYRRFIGRTRTLLYLAFLAVCAGFTIAAYLVPLPWTGFQGQTLWNWFTLLLLPVAVACTVALISKRIHPIKLIGMLRPRHKVISAGLGAGWVVTVIGGYGLRWGWTGYPGNTLWDWLQLLLLPLVFPTILLPAILRWITGNAPGRANAAAVAPALSEPASEAVSDQEELTPDHA